MSTFNSIKTTWGRLVFGILTFKITNRGSSSRSSTCLLSTRHSLCPCFGTTASTIFPFSSGLLSFIWTQGDQHSHTTRDVSSLGGCGSNGADWTAIRICYNQHVGVYPFSGISKSVFCLLRLSFAARAKTSLLLLYVAESIFHAPFVSLSCSA